MFAHLSQIVSKKDDLRMLNGPLSIEVFVRTAESWPPISSYQSKLTKTPESPSRMVWVACADQQQCAGSSEMMLRPRSYRMSRFGRADQIASVLGV